MNDLELNSIQDLKNEGKSFYWASFFLPKDSKIKAGILYSICRYFDNVADSDSEDRSKYLKETIQNVIHDKKNVVNVFLQKNNISNYIFIDLIKGLISDQSQVKIKNKKELITYSYHVAGTVGLMMSKIIGVKNKKAQPCAIDLGIAMQLTNIARDVYEDAKMQRVYLPSEWIPDIDLTILNGTNKINLKQEKKISEAIHKLINLSEIFYLNGFSGLRYVPFKTRLAIFIAANIYRGIGIKIKKNGNKYLTERVFLNIYEKILITIKSIFIFIFLPIMNYQYSNLRDSMPNENL
ncbi:squalene/phytoene synthase family protein [Pelagibacteraceae bacterium]|nr:squalene/phytoene synthase family protein [Pelagibacteraceae bacterium]